MKYFIYLMFFIMSLNATSNRSYDIESGKIFYRIYGGGVFSPDINLSIKGKEKLFFRNWGQERIESMKRTERLVGVLQSLEKSRSLKKRENKILYSVDFENESIIPSKFNTIKEQIDFSKMKQYGTMVIASLPCDVWKSKNRIVCVNKGMVLLDEKSYLGFTYGKIATDVDQNATLTEEDFALPPFPVKKDLLLKDKIKTTQTHKEKTLSDKILSANAPIDQKDKRYSKALHSFSKELFQKEKDHFLSLFNSVLKTRACLYKAESTDDANLCLNELFDVDQENEDKILSSWDEKIKKKLLDDFDMKVGQFVVKVPCINRTLNISDLAECMK